jgi:Domain of unknown function (DUF4397)
MAVSGSGYAWLRMRLRSKVRRALPAAAVGALALCAAAPAAAATEVRFVHAVPAAGGASLQVKGAKGTATIPDVTFAHASAYTRTPSGKVTLSVVPANSKKKIASNTETLGAGRYTAVAAAAGSAVDLRIYKDGKAVGGKASVRVIHAAAELMQAGVKVGQTQVATDLKPGATTGYRKLEPGTYDLQVDKPGKNGAMLAEKKGVALTAGSASTVVAVGSGGKPVQFVIASDSTSAPSTAPATGLGGLSDEQTPWALAFLAALLAAAGGGTAYTLASRARRGRAG